MLDIFLHFLPVLYKNLVLGQIRSAMQEEKAPITLNEVLEEMERKQPFNIEFRKLDEKKKTAGQKKRLDGVVLHGQDWPNQVRTVKIPDAPQDKDLCDIHIRLILSFNGRRVIY